MSMKRKTDKKENQTNSDGQKGKKSKMEVPISSKSLQHRQKGNELYLTAQSGMFGNSMAKIKFQDALKCYNQAYACSANCDEKASALKNIAATSHKLFDLLSEDFGKQISKEMLYYAKSALRNYDEAYQYCDYKKVDWGTHLLEKINEMGQEIIDFYTNDADLAYEESMANIETCAFSLNKLKLLKTEMFHVVAKSRFSKACVHLSNKDFQKCLRQLAECSRPIEEALKNPVFDNNLVDELLTLQLDIVHNKCVSESLQAVHIGNEMLEKYINSEEELNMDMVWLVIDKYKEAILLTREKNVEVEAIALSRLGRINDKILLNREKAKECYRRSLQLALSLIPRTFDQDEWFREAQQAMEYLQTVQQAEEDERKRKLREPYMKEIKKEIQKIEDITSLEGYEVKVYEMIIFTYKNYPLKHKDEKEVPKLDKKSDEFRSSVKQALKGVITDYHPDKVDENIYGFKYKILCEEISKVFTGHYNCFKG